jgi:SacI restriction endonuclease
MAEGLPQNFVESARQRLQTEWDLIRTAPETAAEVAIPEELIAAIGRSVNSKTKTYRYVLPTQILAKLTDGELDCRSIQASSDLKKSFDARSLCHDVIVKFDRANNNVLGGSAEPYLNNPLRIPAIVATARAAQRDKLGFDDLRLVLDFAQHNPGLIGAMMREVLVQIRRRLNTVSVVYPVPNRVSLQQVKDILSEYLAEKSGGLRLQAVTIALFRQIGRRFRLYEEVRSAAVNAADAATGSVADLECVDKANSVVLAIEVKDRQLRLIDTQNKLPAAREKSIRELLFLVQGRILREDADAVSDLLRREFVTGQNVYVVEFSQFLGSCLVLFGETGRVALLRLIGDELEKQKAEIVHRRTWASLLGKL